MAQKNKPSQAERAAESKKRSASQKSESKKVDKAEKDTNKKQDTAENVMDPIHIPVRFIGAVMCLVLFVLFVVMLFKADGILPNFAYDLTVGLIGKTGFFLCIPVLAWLFGIIAFSGNKPVSKRCVCLCVFVLLVGCIAHLIIDPRDFGEGFSVAGLYSGGTDGTTGGAICGLIAMSI